MKKFLITLVSILAIIILAVAIVFGGKIRTVTGVHQVNGNEYLYEMDYSASYDLDDLVSADIDGNRELVKYILDKLTFGLADSDRIVSSGPAEDVGNGEHCTSFQTRNSEGDGWIFGRNYDYAKNPTLVLHSHPSDGYSSLSVCDLSHLGYKDGKLPKDFKSKLLCIAAVYAPMDGINEKGLCTSIMALPNQAARQNTGKHVVGTSIIMRLWLDRCATVDEALALLETVDVRHDAATGSGYHYMLCDAEGNCAVVEFDPNKEWETMVIRKPVDSTYMHVTNHLLDPKYYTTEPDPVVGNPHSKSWWRYDCVVEYMAGHNDGVISLDEAQECLAEVHWENLVWPNGMVETTQYSNVYDQKALTLRLRPWNDYGVTYNFSL